VAPVPRWSIMLGRTLGGATVATLQGMVVFIISLFIGFRPEIAAQSFLALIFMILVAVFFTAFGTTIASRLEDMQAFPLIINFIIMPLFFLSGALFPIENVSGPLHTIIIFNPLSYGVDGIRGALTNQIHFGFANDFTFLIIVTFIVLAIGTYLFSKVEV
jgi:ABC-2 type transport system permease protein